MKYNSYLPIDLKDELMAGYNCILKCDKLHFIIYAVNQLLYISSTFTESLYRSLFHFKYSMKYVCMIRFLRKTVLLQNEFPHIFIFQIDYQNNIYIHYMIFQKNLYKQCIFMHVNFILTTTIERKVLISSQCSFIIHLAFILVSS